MSSMKALDRFLTRCRGWARALEYALFIASDSRMRFALVLEIRCDDDARDDLRWALPGWTIQHTGDEEWARLVPPGYLTRRSRS